MVRFLNNALLLGLGASLAIVVPRLVSHAGSDPGPAAVAPALVPPQPQLPRLAGPALQQIAARDPASWSCYERVRRIHRGTFTDEAVSLHLSIGISGRVKHVAVTPATRKLEPFLPCIREDVAKWTFPPNDEEYGVDVHDLAVGGPSWMRTSSPRHRSRTGGV